MNPASALDSVCVTPHEFVLPGAGANARTGVLLIHGLTGTPNEMRLLAKGLNKAGFTIYGVQLAGHCGTMDDLNATRWPDWVDSVLAGAERFAPQVDRLVVGGLSMGAILSLALAQRWGDRIAGVCALSPIFRYDGWAIPAYTRLAFLLPTMRRLGIGRHSVFMEQPPYGIKDEALRNRVVSHMHGGDSAEAGLPGNPWWSIIEMNRLSKDVKRDLKRIVSPCFVMHATQDDVASPDNARTIQRGVKQTSVELVMLEDSYHMITIDRERRTVIARTTDFISRVAAGGPFHSSGSAARAPA